MAQARRMIAEGADIIDIGAESTRPYGAHPVSADEEMTAPAADTGRSRGPRSSRIDRQHEIGRRRMGARYGCGHRQRRLGPAARSRHGEAGGRAKFACHHHAQPRPGRRRHRHRQGHGRFLCPLARHRRPSRYFARQHRARPRYRFWQDLRTEHDGAGPAQRNRACSACRLLVGASRKRFISTVTPSEPHQRLGGSIAAHLVAAQGGARIIRTHDVSETVQALSVAAAIEGNR